TSFNFDQDVKRLEWVRSVLDATHMDLSGFRKSGGQFLMEYGGARDRSVHDAHDVYVSGCRKRGGKLLMYYGWADPALNAQMGVDYYESAVKQMGATTTEFFRLFMVPGMFHCGGGVGCSSFDKLTPLMEWVEKGTNPERLERTRLEHGQ